jgi:hypothetical protein
LSFLSYTHWNYALFFFLYPYWKELWDIFNSVGVSGFYLNFSSWDDDMNSIAEIVSHSEEFLFILWNEQNKRVFKGIARKSHMVLFWHVLSFFHDFFSGLDHLYRENVVVIFDDPDEDLLDDWDRLSNII